VIFEGARDHDLDWPARASLYGPLLLIALAVGLLAGVALRVLGQ
jgi:hypothetical protein